MAHTDDIESAKEPMILNNTDKVMLGNNKENDLDSNSDQSGTDLEDGHQTGSQKRAMDAQRYEQMDWKEKTLHFIKSNWVKILIVIIFFCGQLVVKFSGMIQDADVPGIDDKPHNWTGSINRFVLSHSKFRNAWLIIASLTLDMQFFLVLGWWLYKGFSLRIVMALVLFYGIRAILQQLFLMPFPDGFYWGYPGFPSLMNVYGRQSDFFYSGHVGFSMLCTIEVFRCGAKKCGIFGLCVTFIQAFTLTCFRAHYTIDIFTGLIMAHWTFHVCGYVSDWVDKRCLNQSILDKNPARKTQIQVSTQPLLRDSNLTRSERQRSSSL